MSVPTGNKGVPTGNNFDHLWVSPLVTTGNYFNFIESNLEIPFSSIVTP